MKKRMFLSTILMTLVLLLAVTTATFAWYATGAGSTTYTPDEVGIATEATTVTLGGVTFTADFTNDASEKVVLTDNSGKTGYMAGANPVTGVDIPSGQVGFGTVGVTVTATLTTPLVKGGEESEAEFNAREAAALKEALAALYAEGLTSITLSVSASDKVRVASASGDVYSADAEGDAVVTFDLVLVENGSTSTWTEKTVYYSVIGTDNPEDENTFALQKITATLAKTVVQP